MSIHSFVEKHWVKRSVLSYLLLPFAFLFSLILCFRRSLYKHGIFRSYNAESYIISVGNLTVGGNGKTPFTILLAQTLKDEGLRVAVSHRGYKGAYEHTIKLVSDEEKVYQDACCAGDEPLLLAENLKGIPVIVGSNRKAAIQYVQKKLFPDVVILDDSFQHLQVHHDYDFLLFSSGNPLGNGLMTPAGMLREPVSAIKYADCFVLNDISEEYSIPKLFKKYLTPLFSTSYRIGHIIHYKDDEEYEPSSFTRKKILLISGIGNPVSFEASMKKIGLNVVHHEIFEDHHEYTESDVVDILLILENYHADVIITTEKDFVKLKNLNIDLTKFYYAKLEIVINETDIFCGIVNKLKKEISLCNS